jgi:hypothetical protein
MNTKDHVVSTERALDLALEALERLDGWLVLRYGSGLTPQEQQVVTAIKQARSAPYVASPRVQEPDEWPTGCPECGMDSGCDCDSGTWNPPKRQWVGLTDEEIEPYYAANKPLIKWVEAKLKAKNFA